MSSLGDLLNMALLLLIASRTKKKGVIVGAYLAVYSVGRFVIEMFRGDEERGMIGALSTSQFYGIFMFIVGIAILAFAVTRRPKEVEA